MVKNPPAKAGDKGSIPCTHTYKEMQEESLEKGMATHSSILAWRIPWSQTRLRD